MVAGIHCHNIFVLFEALEEVTCSSVLLLAEVFLLEILIVTFDPYLKVKL